MANGESQPINFCPICGKELLEGQSAHDDCAEAGSVDIGKSGKVEKEAAAEMDSREELPKAMQDLLASLIFNTVEEGIFREEPIEQTIPQVLEQVMSLEKHYKFSQSYAKRLLGNFEEGLSEGYRLRRENARYGAVLENEPMKRIAKIINKIRDSELMRRLQEIASGKK